MNNKDLESMAAVQGWGTMVDLLPELRRLAASLEEEAGNEEDLSVEESLALQLVAEAARREADRLRDWG